MHCHPGLRRFGEASTESSNPGTRKIRGPAASSIRSAHPPLARLRPARISVASPLVQFKKKPVIVIV